METRRFELDVEGGSLSVLHIPNPGAPRLLFAHANGFNASSYRQFLSRLAEGFEIVAPDTRGHGLSQVPVDPKALRDWHGFARDLAHVAASMDERPTFFAAHSMGSVSGILAAAHHGLKVQAMALIEPIFMPFWFYVVPHIPGGAWLYQYNPMSNGARGRRADWPSRTAILESYREKRLFKHFAPGALEDYLETGVIDMDDGSCRLACDPHWEAAIFASHGHNPWTALRQLACPVSVIRSVRPGSTVYPVWRIRRHGISVDETQAGHLAPMEQPDEMARWVFDQSGERT